MGKIGQGKPEVFSSIRYYHSTFDAINIGTLRAFLEASKEQHPVFMQVYGQSECGPMILRYHRLENLGTVSGRDMGLVWKVTQKHASQMPKESSPSWRKRTYPVPVKRPCCDLL